MKVLVTEFVKVKSPTPLVAPVEVSVTVTGPAAVEVYALVKAKENVTPVPARSGKFAS